MGYLYESKDGLCHSNHKDMIDAWDNCVKENEEKTKAFCKFLMDSGIKALHPDDGWVDRENNTVHFCYPDFILDIKIGDKIALGDYRKYRICQVTDVIKDKIFGKLDRYKFIETNITEQE